MVSSGQVHTPKVQDNTILIAGRFAAMETNKRKQSSVFGIVDHENNQFFHSGSIEKGYQ